MSIEFPCSGCGQTLRVSDDAAGKRAKCPKCNHINQIPQSSPSGEDVDLGLDLPAEGPGIDAGDSPFGKQPANPYSSPQAGYDSPLAGAASSPFSGGRIENVPTDIGSILNYSIAVWQKNLGILVGAIVVVFAVNVAFSYGLMIVMAVMAQAGQEVAAAILNLLGSVAGQLVQIYLGIGMTQLMLNLARDQRADFGQLFGGGPRFLPVLGVSILFGLAVAGGFILLIIPAFIVLLMWWPCYYLVVDAKSSVMESFGLARTITQGNMGTTFLVWLVGLGIAGIGLLACCVGIVVAVPLSYMLFVVAYLMMSGQIPLQPEKSLGKDVLA